tara:strand:+ start:320 stop:508 length:189 start_codon:yes stop_codon:yes gene_type:complete
MTNKNHDADNDFLCSIQLERIANSLEEILRLVKKDQEESKKRWEAADQRDEEYDSEVDSEKN